MNEKHSVTINGHATSLTLEPLFWKSLGEIATAKGISRNALITKIDKTRDLENNLSSAVRVYVLKYYKEALG